MREGLAHFYVILALMLGVGGDALNLLCHDVMMFD
jgi:hypothetical protein